MAFAYGLYSSFGLHTDNANYAKREAFILSTIVLRSTPRCTISNRFPFQPVIVQFCNCLFFDIAYSRS